MRVSSIAAAFAFVLYAAASDVASVQATAHEPTRAQEQAGDQCRQNCQEMKDDRDAICRGLPTQKARETCLHSSNEQHAECIKTYCTSPKNDCLERCKELCYQLWEKCRDDCPRGDKNCLSECTNALATCNRECDRKCK